jgi:uncharacterized protein (TIGR03437 family)
VNDGWNSCDASVCALDSFEPDSAEHDSSPDRKDGAVTVPIILSRTGFGPTNPIAPFGAPVPSDKTYSTTALADVTINNVPATVYGAALAPGFAGLYQIAIQVPTSIADGDWPIQASIGGVQSPTGTVISLHP